MLLLSTPCTQECVFVKTCHIMTMDVQFMGTNKSNCHSHVDCKLCSRKLYFHTFPQQHASVRYLRFRVHSSHNSLLRSTVLYY